jgi:uncharacterized membrane protein (Fun14 family)
MHRIFSEDKMSAIITQFFLSLGVSGIGGFLIGYATKKTLKIIGVFLGLYLISLLYLMHIKVIKIDFVNLFATVNNLFNQALSFFSNIVTYLPVAGSFFSGFILGIIKG